MQKYKTLDIGVLGHVDHGKTTFITAIAKMLKLDRRTSSLLGIDSDQVSIQVVEDEYVRVSFVANNTRYTFHDLAGQDDWVRNLLSGKQKLDGAVLVVAATDGPMPQTREHIKLASDCGITQMALFMNKTDYVEDEELVDMAEMDAMELLCEYDYSEDDILRFRGSALKCVEDMGANTQPFFDLIANVIRSFAPKPYPEDQPFFMPIEKVYDVKGMGMVALGCIVTGKVRAGDWPEAYGHRELPVSAQILSVEKVGKTVDVGGPGDVVGVFLGGCNPTHIMKGQILAESGSLMSEDEFSAEIYIYTKAEGGRSLPLINGCRGFLMMNGFEMTALLEMQEDMLMPGNHATVTVKTLSRVAIDYGMHFDFLDSSRVKRASGVIVPTW